MLHGMRGTLQNGIIGGVVSEPSDEDGSQSLGRDGYACVALKQAADPLQPRCGLQGTVRTPLRRVEEKGATLRNIVKLEDGAILGEDGGELRWQRRGKGAIEPEH